MAKMPAASMMTAKMLKNPIRIGRICAKVIFVDFIFLRKGVGGAMNCAARPQGELLLLPLHLSAD